MESPLVSVAHRTQRKRSDHPDVFDWCCREVSRHLEAHRDRARSEYPRAEVLLAPTPTPAELAERAEGPVDSTWARVRALVPA